MPTGVYERKPITEETRKRMGKSQMGHLVSKETRKKISLKNLGNKHTEETKRILSDKMKIIAKEKDFGGIKGRKMSNEEKKMRSKVAKEKGMGNWMKDVWKEGRASQNSLKALLENNYSMEGKKHTEESKRKMSLARTKGLDSGRIKTWNKDLKIDKDSELYKKIYSEEMRKRVSNSNKGKIRTDEMRKKSSERMKGNIMSEISKKKISAAQQGILEEDWKGFVSFEPYDLNFNKRFKNSIRKRDNQICMLCNIHREKLKRALSVHHINYDKKLTIPQNCISLCDCCHIKTNHNRKHWIKLFQSLLNEKYGYNYLESNEVILNIGEEVNVI